MIAYAGNYSNNDSTMTWDGNIPTAATHGVSTNYWWPPERVDTAWEVYQKWLRSRNWIKAPQVIKPVISVMGKRIIWHRFINKDWTGKNFRKVHV